MQLQAMRALLRVRVGPVPMTPSSRPLGHVVRRARGTTSASSAGPAVAPKLSQRGRALAGGGGGAAAVWEAVNALAAKPGMINMGQGFPDYPPSPVAREVSAAAISSGESAMNQSVSRRCAMLLAYVALRCVLPALLFGTDPPRVESQTEPLPPCGARVITLADRYSPQPGLLALRESVAAFYSRRYGACH